MNANQFKHHSVVDLPARRKGGTNTTNSAKPYLKKRVGVPDLLIVLVLMMQAACASATQTPEQTSIISIEPSIGPFSTTPTPKPISTIEQSFGPSSSLPQGVYLLPSVGGVGVGRQLQMALYVLPPSATAGQTPKITWIASNPEVASVDKFGKVTGLDLGTTTIAAKVDQENGTPLIFQSTITVGEPVSSVTAVMETENPVVVLTQTEISIPCYCSKPVLINVQDSLGHLLNDRLVIWKSETPETASELTTQLADLVLAGKPPSDPHTVADDWFLHRTGTVIGHQAGTTSITATSEGISFVINVVITPNGPASLKISPESMLLDVQETQHATVTGNTAEGCPIEDPLVIWQSADPTIAEVDSQTGEVRGLKAGTTVLTATAPNGVSANINVNIPAVNTITIESSQISELDICHQKTITVTPRSESGAALAHRNVTWSVSNSDIVALVPLGDSLSYTATVTGKAVGSAVVTATSEGVSASVTVYVVATCTDGCRNGRETDRDCGGLDCPKCAAGMRCQSNTDCATDNCLTGVCWERCYDQTQNYDETDIDCGGQECYPCPNGFKCEAHSDCSSRNCDTTITERCIANNASTCNGELPTSTFQSDFRITVLNNRTGCVEERGWPANNEDEAKECASRDGYTPVSNYNHYCARVYQSLVNYNDHKIRSTSEQNALTCARSIYCDPPLSCPADIMNDKICKGQ